MGWTWPELSLDTSSTRWELRPGTPGFSALLHQMFSAEAEGPSLSGQTQHKPQGLYLLAGQAAFGRRIHSSFRNTSAAKRVGPPGCGPGPGAPLHSLGMTLAK